MILPFLEPQILKFSRGSMSPHPSPKCTKPLQDENMRLLRPQMSLGNPVHCCRSVKNAIRFGLTTR